MQVDKILLGTVIDHIQSGKGMLIARLLGVDSLSTYRTAIVLNVPSKKMGTKDILKFEGRFLSEKEAGLISLLCPDSTINLIRGAKVSEKLSPKPPSSLERIVPCPNNCCIRNSSPTVLVSISKDKYRCNYCEKSFSFSELF